MNTYNENLRSSIVASLQSQELDQKAVSAELNASLFTLYYAEGATITANEKLNQATKEREEKALVKHQAVTAGNISNNQLASATQGGQYVKQATTNTAVCAANVQVAANAILRLASDLGSIYSIVNAADSDSDIYRQAQEARDLINTTAYEAEVASQMAMNASMLVSEVSASTVMDKSTATNSAMTAMLTIANSDYNTLSQTVSDANANVAAVSAKEKVAEGNFEDMTADNASTNSAYALTNQELNLNLIVTPKLSAESSEMLVGFNLIKYPFKMQEIDLLGKIDISPVKQYYLIFCKDSKKTTFSYGNAESLLLNGVEKQYVTVNMPTVTTPNLNGPGNPVVTVAGKSAVNVDIKYKQLKDTDGSFYTLQDTDGDEIVPGTNYVVFLLASYADDYKKKLNNFDDFLSAPSPFFCLTHILKPVNEPISVFPVSTDI
ncbi:MAG: hypothetical protein H7Y13_14090, partial [Sphingobacteriaceae bacterium]|nr:hypothetical protein [Sphingobacteriaceae bacterium]